MVLYQYFVSLLIVTYPCRIRSSR